jgi:2-polyprenyl-3-methyl-5-hydroxy-6-metoxy-1,4-benzoquinol methylase
MQSKDNVALAGKDHWDNSERNVHVELQPFAPFPGIRGFGRRMWHEAFQRTLKTGRTAGGRLLELGCGGSAFLPYFARQYGFEVCGIDYSETGCDLAREMCSANDVSASVVCADFFNPPEDMLGSFDVVTSFGVVEHFADTAQTLASFARYLRPGGLLLTVVPNMQGACGQAQRLLSKEVYEMHEVITPERLRKGYLTAQMEVIECAYFLFSNFGVINPGNNASRLKRIAFQTLRAATGLIWSAESVLLTPFKPNRFTSPYVWCVGRTAP